MPFALMRELLPVFTSTTMSDNFQSKTPSLTNNSTNSHLSLPLPVPNQDEILIQFVQDAHIAPHIVRQFSAQFNRRTRSITGFEKALLWKQRPKRLDES